MYMVGLVYGVSVCVSRLESHSSSLLCLIAAPRGKNRCACHSHSAVSGCAALEEQGAGWVLVDVQH